MAKPYRMKRIGILNHEGGIWTPETFGTKDAAQAYINNYQRQNPNMDLSRHRPATVRVTVSLIKSTTPSDKEGGESVDERAENFAIKHGGHS
ncbi:hypothetical protein [Brevundimonas naejangsanensis]|uniref:hypothetical protein n=1 Tax=Brevundimonas naejangsanensis TaxID=588932 RepID=UPI0032084674